MKLCGGCQALEAMGAETSTSPVAEATVGELSGGSQWRRNHEGIRRRGNQER
ncbi:hypothetical protein OIU74_005060 [Salix koriyanagi]|uniref:Uncharacterized protein n=1 Tax=Salix koriyanagi TaxID=2511006 RepID=A0A9Q0UNH7_9ROSI|nr:hypothetical protein OIU74_005060 [Salix koriyanagi]